MSMTAPRIVCASCSQPTSFYKPICDDCMIAAGKTPTPFCALCEATLVTPTNVLRAENGVHKTKSGGYAGKCAAAFTQTEPA